MFHKIRVQLAALNALVIFIILLICGASLYFYMDHRLTREVDDQLFQAAGPLRVAQPGGTLREDDSREKAKPISERRDLLNRQGGRMIDRPVVSLLWSEAGELLTQAPEDVFDKEELELFRTELQASEPQTISVGDNTYRVLAVPFTRQTLQSVEGTPVVQLVRSLNEQEEMLNRLLIVVVIGTMLGGLATVLAGFFLAGRALVPIRRAWDKQTQFVADASHELRTPLAVVRSHTELMLRHPDQTIEEQSQNVSTIFRETKRMSKLVSDLLTLAGSDSNRLEVVRAKIQLDALIGEIAEEFSLLAEVEGLELHTSLEGPIHWEADEARIRQLIVILLDNALKYTPSPGTVEINCRRTGQGVEIIVADTGVGIAANEVPLIFDRFYRSDQVRTRREGGTGLGLSIAKWIVEAHQGKIWVESELGAGTKMHVLFPIRGNA